MLVRVVRKSAYIRDDDDDDKRPAFHPCGLTTLAPALVSSLREDASGQALFEINVDFAQCDTR